MGWLTSAHACNWTFRQVLRMPQQELKQHRGKGEELSDADKRHMIELVLYQLWTYVQASGVRTAGKKYHSYCMSLPSRGRVAFRRHGEPGLYYTRGPNMEASP